MTAWHALFRKSAHDTLYVHALSTFFSEQGECFALKHRRCPSAGRAPGCSRPEEVVLQLRQAEEHRRAGNSRGAEERPAQYSRSSAKIVTGREEGRASQEAEKRHWPRGCCSSLDADVRRHGLQGATLFEVHRRSHKIARFRPSPLCRAGGCVLFDLLAHLP